MSGTDQRNVVLAKQGPKIVAAMPYFVRKQYGFILITHLPLTRTLGPWIRPAQADHSGQVKLSAQAAQRYTYNLDDLTDLDGMLSQFFNDTRRRLRKAERGGIRVEFDIPVGAFYENRKMTLADSGEKISYSYQLFKRIYEAGYANGAARAIGTHDESGNLHAAAFNIWDENSTYDLIGTADRRFRSSGGASLLMWHQIQHAATKSRCFDFEGSMIQSVETFIREFNPRQVPYHCVSKTPSRLYALARNLQSRKLLRNPTNSNGRHA